MKIIHQTYISAFLFYLAIRFKFKYTFDSHFSYAFIYVKVHVIFLAKALKVEANKRRLVSFEVDGLKQEIELKQFIWLQLATTIQGNEIPRMIF